MIQVQFDGLKLSHDKKKEYILIIKDLYITYYKSNSYILDKIKKGYYYIYPII